MATASPTSEALSMLEHECGQATVAVIRAQLAYASLAARPEADDSTFADAWLRLWRAEERQREVFSAIERLSETR
jgi:hypothetical protein